MPIVGVSIAYVLELPPALAAGMVLLGACPSEHGLQCDDVSGERRYRSFGDGVQREHHLGASTDDVLIFYVGRRLNSPLIVGRCSWILSKLC